MKNNSSSLAILSGLTGRIFRTLTHKKALFLISCHLLAATAHCIEPVSINGYYCNWGVGTSFTINQTPHFIYSDCNYQGWRTSRVVRGS